MTHSPPVAASGLLPDAVSLRPSAAGPLSGTRFAIKDVFDVAGTVTGFGHPAWRRDRPPANTTAPSVERLVAVGADLAGRTICDELCYSLTGINPHYGTPPNPRAPDCLPGGSSSGSASVVAAGLFDFSLGTDCGGSVRVPASYCGICGFRPSHGYIDADGVVALAPSFDCVGIFAREPGLLADVARVLLPPGGQATANAAAIALDAFELLEPEIADELLRHADHLAERIAPEVRRVRIGGIGLRERGEAFRLVQASEIWQRHGAWGAEHESELSQPVAARLQWARTVAGDALDRATRMRETARSEMADIAPPGTIILLPTATPAPRLTETGEELERIRAATLALTATAGLCGLPQVHVPLTTHAGRPVGLSLMASRGSDMTVLEAAKAISTQG